MFTVLAITLPIFMVVGLGFATTRGGLFSTADMRIFGRFVINIALPAMLFTAIAKRDLVEIFDVSFMGAYAAASLLMVALGLLWFHRIQGRRLGHSAICIMGVACSNSGYMSFPILTLAFPERAPTVLAMCLLVENLLLVPTCLIIASLGRGEGQPRMAAIIARILRDLIRRPLILSLIAGLLWSLFGLELPAELDRATSMIATSAVALALFVIGGSLAQVALKGNLSLALQITAGKLLLHPLAAVLILALIAALGLPGLPTDLAACLIIATAVPMMGVYTIFAQEEGMEVVAALAMLLTTSASFFTLSAVLAFLL
jgi:malonate transporter